MTNSKKHLLIITLYLSLTIALTWPLGSHLTTHIPGEATWAFDESTFIWNMWWFKHSLLNVGQSPLHTDYTFFPLGVQLTTYTFNLFNAALALPLTLAFGLPLANNFTLIFAYASSGYGMYLLMRYLLSDYSHQPRTEIAAFLAGCVFAFSASRMMYVALGHYNFVTIQWFPYYALFLLKTLHSPRYPFAALAALFAALCIYAELTYSVFLLFLTLVLLLHERPLRLSWIRHTVSYFALLVCLTFMLTAPFILTILPDFLDPAYAQPGWGEGLKLSADLIGLLTLTPLHPLSGLEWQAELRAVIEGTSRFSDANTLFLGYGILLFALSGAILQWPRSRPWVWSAILFVTLSLGPLLTINGQNHFDLDGIEVTYPLPFALLHYIPIINANRVPNRFGIPLTLALAVLVGYALFSILRRWPRSQPMLMVAAMLGLFLLMTDQYSVPLPLTSAEIPSVYTAIGAETEPSTLMQLPLGWRNSYGTLGAERTQLQYYQSAHLRPMLGGNTSRNPAFNFDYYRHIPLFFALTETELYRPVDDETLARARQQAAELMTLYHIKYLVVHDPLPHRKPYEDTAAATQALALDLIPHQPEPVYESAGVRAYAVQPAEIPNPLRLDLGEWSSDPYRGMGWAGNETVFSASANWVTASSAALFFPAHGDAPLTLTMQIAPFSYPSAPVQQLTLSLNGHAVDTFALSAGWQIITALLPAEYQEAGLNRLTLEFAHTAQPREVLPANLAIGQTGWQIPRDVELNSASDFAFITVGYGDDAVDASAHRRGVNVAVLEATSGELLDQQGFDTAANGYEVAALTDYLTALPANRIVLLSTQGLEATAFFTPDTWATLQQLGLPTTPLTPPFSAIGVTGASPDTAPYAQGEGTAYLRLGLVPDTRNLAAAVDWVEIRQ